MENWTAIIPARKGSKGLKNKNLRILDDKMLFEISIDHAMKAGASQIIVTSDINEILNRKHFHKIVQTHTRPKELCGDSSKMADVVLDVINNYITEELIVLLQPTSPLRRITDIKKSIRQYVDNKYELCMSACKVDSSVLKYGVLNNSTFIPINKSEYCFMNRQNLPNVVKPNGAIYVFSRSDFLENDGWPTNFIGSYLMPEEFSHDIDSLEDFIKIEKIIKAKKNEN